MNKIGDTDIYNSVNLLLAEKRTSLAVLRTAIAIFTLPLSVFTVLTATSSYYEASESLHFIVPLLAICILLAIIGIYLILKSFKRLRYVDQKIQKIKSKEECIKDILEK